MKNLQIQHSAKLSPWQRWKKSRN